MKILAALLAAAVLFSPRPTAAEGTKLRVLTSFLPIYLFTQNVVGNASGITVEMMLPASLGCPHDYSLSPGDMKKIAMADLFLANGLGMEEFLGTPVRRANPGIRVVETASSVPPLRAGAGQGDINPHTWVSPRNAILQVRAIERALSEASPANGPIFHRNADAYAGRLASLAREFDEAAKHFRNRNVVIFHNVFDYLARDLRLTVVGRIEETPGQTPSAGEIKDLIRTIRERGAAAVFAELQYPEKLARTVAEEAGIPVRMLDPVSTGSTAPTSYEEAMARNLRTLTEALGTR